MPRDLPTDVGAGADDERKKRKRRPPGNFASGTGSDPGTTPDVDVADIYTPAPSPVPARILKLNKDVGRVVPTEVTYALGESNLTDEDLGKAARFFSQQFDLSPEDFFAPVTQPKSLLPSGKTMPGERGTVGYSLGGIPDPITGEPYLSLRTARRLLEKNEESIIQKWLEGRKATPDRRDAKGNVIKGEGGVSSKAIIRQLNTLTPLVGEDLNFGEAVEIARQVVESKAGKSFAQNLDVTMRTAFSQNRKQAISIAIEASKDGYELRDIADLAAYLGGATREEVAAGVAMQDTKNIKELQANGQVVKAGVGDLQVLGSIYDALRQREQSFSEAAATIMDEMRVEQSDDQSLGELWLSGTLKAFQIANRPMDAFFRVVADTDAMLAPFEDTGGWVEIMPDGTRVRHTEGTRLGDAVSDGWEILTGEQNVLDNARLKELGWSDSEILIGELYLSILIPVGGGVKAVGTAAGKVTGKNLATRLAKSALTTREGAVATLRLGGELAIDPFTGFGKLGKVSTGRKFLPFMDAAAQGRAAEKMLFGKHRVLKGLDIATYLDRAAQSAVNPDEMFGKAVSRFRAEFSRDGIHPMLARAIFNWSRKAAAAGLDEAARVRGIREFMGQAIGIPIKADGLGAELAAEVERLHMAGRRRAVAEATSATRPSAMAQEIAGRAQARKAAQQIADQVDRFARDIDLTGPIMHEIPKIKALRTVGATGAKFDTAAARAYRALKINELPVRQGSRFMITPDLDPADAADALDTVLVRSRLFNPQEMAEWRQRLTSAMRPGFAARESATYEVITEVEGVMMKRLSDQLGVPADTLQEWVTQTFGQPLALRRAADSVKRRLGYDPDNAFGIVDAGPIVGQVPVRTPLRPAQLQNAFGIIDPVYVRKAAKETMGYFGELNAMALRLGFGDSKVGAAFEKASRTLAGNQPSTTFSKIVGTATRELVRPAIGLVKFGWVARPAYVLRIVAGDELLRYAATEGLAARFMASRLAARMLKNRNLPSTADIMLRTGLSEEDAIALKLTHLLADEPQAGQGAIRSLANAQGDILPPDIQRAIVGRWEAITRDAVPDQQFNAAWERALFQYGQDDTGKRMLRNMLAGMDNEDNIDDILRWWRKEGQADFNRMKANVKEFQPEESVRISVEYLDTLLPDKSFAQRVLDGTLQPEDLGRLDGGPMVIHGPALHPQNSANVLVRAQRFWGKWILEMPTNQLIRQPFFKANYSTVYQSLRERALLAGKEIDEPLDAAMKEEAKRFAIARTQQIMFDFTRTGRISELLWFVSPFFQPFTEFFLAWPKIVKQNPAMVPYAYRLGKAATESGFFKEDPQSGEQVVPMSNWVGAAPLLALTTGGKLADTPGGGWELMAPLSAFNMFATNAYPYKFDGGTIPIPTPSFSPPVQWFLQWSIDKMPINDATKQDWMAYLTEFGEIDFTRPQDFMLPSWMKHALTAAVPSWFESQTNANVERFMAMQQAMGLDPDKKVARGQAQAFGFMRAYVSLFFPASPRVSFPTAEREAEFAALRDKHGGDSLAALAEYAGVYNPDTGKFEGGIHPGEYLIAASKTMWEDESNPFPMPANIATERILNSAGGRAFAEQFPRWAFFIIPKEIREGEFNHGAFIRQVTENRRVYRNPAQWEASAEVQNGWNAYFAVKTQWDAWQLAHPDQAKGDPSFDARAEEYEQQIDGIAEFFPEWEGAYKITIDRGVDRNVMAEARQLIQSEEFTTKTDGGAGLKMYMDGRDELERDMAEANVDNLDTKLAERLGFVKRYETLVEQATSQHPDFQLMYDYLGFENDLRYGVTTAGQRERDAVPEEAWKGLTDWQDEYEKRLDAPYADDIIDPADAFPEYKKIRNWANTAYDRADGINPLKLWWAETNPEERSDYRAGLGTRSAIYWSRFDWEVMGIKQTPKQQEFWVEVDRLRSEAFAGDNVGADLDRVDALVKKTAAKNKGIAKQLKVINTWHYGLEQAVFNPDQGEALFRTKNTKDDWEDVFDGSQAIHDYMNKYDMTGADDPDPDLRDWYDEIKKQYTAYIEKKIKDNPVFGRQWAYLQDRVGTDFLIDALMPTSNYDLGVADKDTVPAVIKQRAGREPLMNGNAASAQDYAGDKTPLKTRNGVKMVAPALNDLSRASKELGLGTQLFRNVDGNGHRTTAEQRAAYDRYQSGQGATAAPPGTSMHEAGRAIDINSEWLKRNPEVVEWLARAGWVNAVPNEPWHWEYQG